MKKKNRWTDIQIALCYNDIIKKTGTNKLWHFKATTSFNSFSENP